MIAAVPTGVWLPWLGALIFAASCVGYIVAAARGQERPSRVTWGVWSVTAGIATVSSWSAGAPPPALVVTAVAALVPAAVVAATLVPVLRGQQVPVDPPTRMQRLIDWTCLGCSAAILAAWVVTDNPTAALALITATDAVAAVPTMGRAWRGQEPYAPYLGGVVSGGFTLLSITSWDLPAWLFPVYFLGMNAVVCTLITVHRVVPRQTATPILDAHLGVLDLLQHPPPGLRPPPDLSTEVTLSRWRWFPHAVLLCRLVPYRDLQTLTATEIERLMWVCSESHRAGWLDRARITPVPHLPRQRTNGWPVTTGTTRR